MSREKSLRGRGPRGIKRQGDAKDVIVKVRVDAERKKRYDQLRQRMAAARREEAAGFDDYWEAADDILEQELWNAGGYDTEQAFCKEVLKQDVRTAKRLAKVARHATEKEIEKYLPTLLEEVITLLEIKGGAPLGRVPVSFQRVRIEKLVDGKRTTVGLDEASVADVRAHKRELLRRKGKARRAPSAAAQTLIDAITTIASLARVKLSVSDGLAHIGDIPLAAINTLGRALAHVTLESPGEGPSKRPKPAAKKKRARGPRPR
jgi:hypothetical protein